MEKKLDLILNELKELKGKVDNLEQGQKELRSDVKNLNTVSGLLADLANDTNIKVSNIEKKLDRHDASLRSHHERLNELELRVQHLEDGLLPESPKK